ncbi:chromosome segregation protein SMC [candidate division KSB1 bacterium]|nr:chromosome segregation protein SMC [candidate division KSB1 bacterium]
MYLDKLKIVGFKSFAKKTDFVFSDGIIAIVGPNGCGKSNVVDAIRWVLGEQKAGILRSDRMENVIFNGTRTLKPMGMAEVSLTIQNTRNILPVEYSEVVITRRLFRSGESQYLINNQVSRLKDITNLLMDTGIAPDAYSVIELKMVESILSGKPEERRRIFEEAAGVTKYKQRRRITFRKLESTENDLIRLEDIITEVGSKVNSLKRQVRRAQRYQEIREQLKELDLRVATFRYSTIHNELNPLRSSLEEMRRDRESGSAETSFKEAELESLKTELIHLEQTLRESQGNLNKINEIIRKREEEILVSRERIKSIKVNNERLQREIVDITEQLKSQKDNSEKLTLNLSEAETKVRHQNENYSSERDKLAAMEQQLQAKRQQAKEMETEKLRLLDTVSQRQGQIEHLKASLEHYASRIDEIHKERDACYQSYDTLDDAVQKMNKQSRLKQDEHKKISNELERVKNELTSTSAKLENVKESIIETKSRIESIRHQTAITQKMLDTYSDYPEGVRHLMVDQSGYPGTVADIISIDDRYRLAIESILCEAATYLLATDHEQAFVGIRNLHDTKKGIVTFLPLNHFANQEQSHSDYDLSSVSGHVVGWADELVTVDDRFKPLIRVLLGDCLVVDDGGLNRSYTELSEKYHIGIVTTNGDMISAMGTIRGGKHSRDDTGFIGRKDQLHKLRQDLRDLESQLSASEKSKNDLDNALRDYTESRETLEEEMAELNKDLSAIRLSISEHEYKRDSNKQQAEKLEREIVQFDQKIETTNVNIVELTGLIENEKKLQLTNEEKISGFSSEITRMEIERETLAQHVHELNLTLIQIQNDEKNMRHELERTTQFIATSEHSITSKQKEFQENQTQSDSLTERIDELSTLLVDDYDEKEKLESFVRSNEEKRTALNENIEQKEKFIRQLRNNKETISEFIHEKELRVAELKLNADTLYRRIGEEYGHDLTVTEIDDQYDLDQDSVEIERLKSRLKALEPVNLLALKEYDSEKERFDFLNKQRDDLIKAKQNLNETIEHINKTANEKFLDVFENIRHNFNKVFTQFFADGQAELILAASEDPLEADIEIVANPKGKRPTSLTLLSGGEKALTAISLLFAIYLVKPSPICILDEVDAPLDDNNIKRFTETVRNFSKETQFLIVTHNKMTMKSADCLYGITMEEPGISKVVSVKMD